MTIFSKIDKKVLIILVAVLVIILLAGFGVYKYLTGATVKVQNSAGGAQTEQKPENAPDNTQQVQIQAGGANGGGTLTVCLDKCGDGICQKSDPNCGNDNNLNCICPETPKECPQDCK